MSCWPLKTRPDTNHTLLSIIDSNGIHKPLLMKTYLVTGAAGFIGSHLCEKLLNANIKVVGIDNFDTFYERETKENNLSHLLTHSNFTFIEADITHFAQLEEKLSPFHIDLYVHLAAKAGVLPSIAHSNQYFDTNITGTKNILDLMVKKGETRKLVFASSSSVYGNNKETPFREDHNVDHPISPYAFTKKACELINYTYHHLYNVDIMNMRLFTVYGQRQRPDLAIHKFIKLISQGKAITMYGDGQTSRDYTFVEDTVSGFIAAINYVENHDKVYETFNLGNSSPVSLRELIDTIYRVTGIEKNVITARNNPVMWK
jgi:UDP-glucuronate 4-epimerase